MKTGVRLLWLVLLVMAISLVNYGCAGTPKMSRWTSPDNLTYDQVFNAALRAGTDNKFTIVSQDRDAGVISMRKQVYAGDKMAERNMSVQLTKQGGRILVATRGSGSDVGLIESALGGAVHKEITHNFYVYLFRVLKITDPSQRLIDIVDDK